MISWVNQHCPCGGKYEARTVEVRLTPPGATQPVVLQSIRQGACPQCGSRVYQAADLERIESLTKPGSTDRSE